MERGTPDFATHWQPGRYATASKPPDFTIVNIRPAHRNPPLPPPTMVPLPRERSVCGHPAAVAPWPQPQAGKAGAAKRAGAATPSLFKLFAAYVRGMTSVTRHGVMTRQVLKGCSIKLCRGDSLEAVLIL